MHGFKGATVRGIAKDAGVSPGLVQHHFPSKQALRDECDGYVFTLIREAKAEAATTGALLDPAFIGYAHEASVAVTRYVAMALATDAPAASTYFDACVDMTYETFTGGGELGPALPPTEETRTTAVVHSAMLLGLSLLFGQVLRALDLDADDPQTAVRLGRAQLFLTTDRIVGDEFADRIRAGLDRYEQAGRRDEAT